MSYPATGLPKAAIIKHKRIYLTSVGFAKMFNIKFSDRIYCTLPLYHSAGQSTMPTPFLLCGGRYMAWNRGVARIPRGTPYKLHASFQLVEPSLQAATSAWA